MYDPESVVNFAEQLCSLGGNGTVVRLSLNRQRSLVSFGKYFWHISRRHWHPRTLILAYNGGCGLYLEALLNPAAIHNYWSCLDVSCHFQYGVLQMLLPWRLASVVDHPRSRCTYQDWEMTSIFLGIFKEIFDDYNMNSLPGPWMLVFRRRCIVPHFAVVGRIPVNQMDPFV